jgi:hypothetical protein
LFVLLGRDDFCGFEVFAIGSLTKIGNNMAEFHDSSQDLVEAGSRELT